jgi:hypothetical protein
MTSRCRPVEFVHLSLMHCLKEAGIASGEIDRAFQQRYWRFACGQSESTRSREWRVSTWAVARNMALLLKRDRRRRKKPCRWVAGYCEYIDWFDSMIVDMLFWRVACRPKTRRAGRRDENLSRVPKTRDLGFGVVMNGRAGHLHDFLEEIELRS